MLFAIFLLVVQVHNTLNDVLRSEKSKRRRKQEGENNEVKETRKIRQILQFDISRHFLLIPFVEVSLEDF